MVKVADSMFAMLVSCMIGFNKHFADVLPEQFTRSYQNIKLK